MTTIVTVKQMCDFTMQQPPDKSIDFTESKKLKECGCLMVQYGVSNSIDFISCGIYEWFSTKGKISALLSLNNKCEWGYPYFRFMPVDEHGSKIWKTTYGEVQKLVPTILADEGVANETNL